MGDWFGAPWATVGWVVATTTAIYATAVVSVRLAGRRTLAQLSAFDFVVTVALGSIVATTAVQEAASYAQGATAIATLLVLQAVVATVRQQFPATRRLLDFRPELVYERGTFHRSTSPLAIQLTEEEIRSRLRQEGVFRLGDVRFVIVEPNGGLSYGDEDLPGEARRDVVRR